MTDLAIIKQDTGEVVPVDGNKPAMYEKSASGYSLVELMTLADRIHRTAMVPQALRNKPDEVLAVFLSGAEIGLPLMGSLQLIDVIQGRPTLNAQGQRAVILGHGHRFWIEETTPERAVACGVRKGEEHVHSAEFTIEEAKAMNLTGKGPWKSSPADMLVARATTRLARRAFADCLLGIAYDPDELEPTRPFDVDGDKPAAIVEEPRLMEEGAVALLVASCANRAMDEDAIETLVRRVTNDRAATFKACLATDYKALKAAIVAWGPVVTATPQPGPVQRADAATGPSTSDGVAVPQEADRDERIGVEDHHAAPGGETRERDKQYAPREGLREGEKPFTEGDKELAFISVPKRTALMAACNGKVPKAREERLAWAGSLLGREVESMGKVTDREAQVLFDALAEMEPEERQRKDLA